MITNNENLYGVYNADGTLSSFRENNSNTASRAGQAQTIGGGENNTVSGSYSTVVGGYNNQIINSISSTIIAGQNGVIKNQNGASLIADGDNRNHYADESNALTIDFANGIYLKNKFSPPTPTGYYGVYNKIDTYPNLVIGSYLASPQYGNISSAKNYYPYTGTSIKIQTNNWIKTPGYPLERIDSISSIELGPNGVKLIGTNANQQVAGNPAVAYIDINRDITLESAKDGNSISLISDDHIYLGGDIIIDAYTSKARIDYGVAFYSASDFNANAKNAINLTSSGANGINIDAQQTSDNITLKSGIGINSYDYNLSLRGQRVNILSNDSSVNLQGENGVNLYSQYGGISIDANSGDAYTDVILRAGRYIKLNSLSIIDRVQNFSLNITGSLV
jgi:hypothetical protein